MVDAATGIGLLAGTVLLLGNAYFVTTEFAMTRIRQFDDEVVGLVYVPALIEHVAALESGERDFADLAVESMTVDPDLPVSDLIDRFQAERQELAVVVADGRTVGLVTATDAFEEITGELEDPLEEIADG